MKTDKDIILAEKVFFESLRISELPKHKVIMSSFDIIRMIVEGIKQSRKQR